MKAREFATLNERNTRKIMQRVTLEVQDRWNAAAKKEKPNVKLKLRRETRRAWA